MAIEFATLLGKYGYAATFFGMLLEGETFLVLSGVAAHRGYLDMSLLVVVGAAGALVSDNIFFAVGRALGPALLTRFPRLAPSAARTSALVERLPNTAVIGVRFLYGMRTVGPAVIGTGTIAWSRYVVLDAFAASLWSLCWVSAGFVLGKAVEQLLVTYALLGRWLLAGAVVAAVLVALIRYSRRKGNPRS